MKRRAIDTISAMLGGAWYLAPVFSYSPFSKLVAPFMAMAMRRANQKDLSVLKRLLEKSG